MKEARKSSSASSKRNCNITIVIPAYNEENHIARCISSVIKQQYMGKIEILVIDGGSEDRTREIAEDIKKSLEKDELRSLEILDNPKKIAASGMNIGFKNGKGNVLIPFSAHAYMAPDFVQKSIDCLNETGADVAGGIVLSAPDSNTYLSKAIGKALNSKFALGGITARTGKKRRPMENPSFGAYRKEIFEKFGYMDETLKRNTDYEFNLRLHKGGAKIMFCPYIKSYYFNRPNLKSLYRQYYDTSFHKAAMIGRYKKVIRPRHLVPSIFFLMLFILVIAGIFIEEALLAAGAVFALYLFGAIIFSLKNILYLPLLPICYLTIHFGYGLGFILGLFSRKNVSLLKPYI
ncbi:MAG: glycosyltransferase family 2 protein [Candidatus Zixiibacteriota bacterium]